MTIATEQTIKLEVSDCFNATHVAYSMSGGVESAYVRLMKLCKSHGIPFHITEEIIDSIEEAVTEMIIQAIEDNED